MEKKTWLTVLAANLPAVARVVMVVGLTLLVVLDELPPAVVAACLAAVKPSGS